VSWFSYLNPKEKTWTYDKDLVLMLSDWGQTKSQDVNCETLKRATSGTE